MIYTNLVSNYTDTETRTVKSGLNIRATHYQADKMLPQVLWKLPDDGSRRRVALRVESMSDAGSRT